MQNPLVSILIPTFNSEKYIEEAVNSALAQTYKNLEIIVHNDASTDNTRGILKKFNDKRLKVITTQSNHGMVGGWNYIMSKAKGKYIKFIASDDILTPDCVELMVKSAESDESIALVTCKRRLIDENGNSKGFLQFSSRSIVTNGRSHARWALTTLTENRVGEPTSVMFRRSLIDSCGYFDVTLHNLVDLEYWVRLLRKGNLAYINKPLCSFRIHGSTSTSRAVREGLFIDDIYKIIEKYSNEDTLQLYNLSENDLLQVKRTKTQDIIKNIKDLVLAGNLSRAMTYLSKLLSHTSFLHALTSLLLIPLRSR